MFQVQRTTESPEATGALAAGLAAAVRGGDIVLLIGELGAGKTTFTRAFAAALGADVKAVSSPTYVMVNRYVASRPMQDIAVLTHIDAYRIRSTEELDALGWDQLFDTHTRRAAGGSVALIEWPQRISEALPPAEECITVELQHAGRTARAMTISVPMGAASRPELGLLGSREPVRCPVTTEWVAPTCPWYPFSSERAKMADLSKWFSGAYSISRPAEQDDTDR